MQAETDPLFISVERNDLPRFQSLLCPSNVNSRSRYGYPLLTFAMQYRRTPFFDLLLATPGLDLEPVDCDRQTPLIAAFNLFSEYFALQLLEAGADAHATDDNGFSLLHLGAWKTDEATLTVGRRAVELGVDVDGRSVFGETPLYVACQAGNPEWVHMLLYYGADVSIASNLGILPVAALTEREPLQVLLDHTFDEERVVVRLATLVQAMRCPDSRFDRILASTKTITFDYRDMQFFQKHLPALKVVHFRKFLRKFDTIVRKMVVEYPPLIRMVAMGWHGDQKAILRSLVESELVVELVQCCHLSYPYVARLMQMFQQEAEVTEIVCLLLSYGLQAISFDLDVVFSYRGFCELFRILLHMDVQVIQIQRRMMSCLYYDFTDFEELRDEIQLSPLLFCYYNDWKLKSRASGRFVNRAIAARVRELPTVPSLQELSRNVARKMLVKRYQVETSVEFYKVLGSLPIDRVTRSILALERRLY